VGWRDISAFSRGTADVRVRRIIDRIRKFGSLSKEEALSHHAPEELFLANALPRAVLSFIRSSWIKLAILSREDLFGEKEQLNLPGTINTYPNWSGKMRYSIEDLWTDPEAQKKAGLFRELIDRSGRGVKEPIRWQE
jgi:4-alpha-glucanotransferase